MGLVSPPPRSGNDLDQDRSSGDEDFFVVNEEAGVGDTVNFIATASGGAQLTEGMARPASRTD